MSGHKQRRIVINDYRLRLSEAKFRLRLSEAKFRLRLSEAKNGLNGFSCMLTISVA